MVGAYRKRKGKADGPKQKTTAEQAVMGPGEVEHDI
jgi:hypothetical protein